MRATQRDQEVLERWWTGISAEIPMSARGLWFGITELANVGGARTLYVAGCPTFDAADGEAEWATDYCWWPKDRYVTLPDFALLPDSPHQHILEYAADLLRNLGLPFSATMEGAAVGFDDGDFVTL